MPRNGRPAAGIAQRTGTMLSLIAGGMLAAHAWRSARALDFRGKTVLIFGGSRGLGLVIARQLAAEGARLVLAARDEAELERARVELAGRGADVTVSACDIRDRGAV